MNHPKIKRIARTLAAGLFALGAGAGLAACGSGSTTSAGPPLTFCDEIAATGSYLTSAFSAATSVNSGSALTKADMVAQDQHLVTQLSRARTTALSAARLSSSSEVRTTLTGFATALGHFVSAGQEALLNTRTLVGATAAQLEAAQQPLTEIASHSPVTDPTSYFAPISRDLKLACPPVKTKN